MNDLVLLAAKGLRGQKKGQKYLPKHIRNTLNDRGNFIEGYKKKYSINRNGDVFDYEEDRKGIPLVFHKCKKGYYYVLLNGKKKYVHMLVAAHYVHNPYRYKHVQFIDGNKRNVKSTNLYWIKKSAEQEIKYKGVKRLEDRYTATFTLQLGSYGTPEEAHRAREAIHTALKELTKDNPARLSHNDYLRGSEFKSGMD